MLKQVGEVKKQLEVASDTIADQEKKITDTGEMVKALFSRGRVEFYEPTLTPKDMVIIKHDETHASVYLLLKEVPIPVTLQLQYHVYVQHRQAYGVLGSGDTLLNVVGFRWGENADNLKSKGLTASYIGDPTAKNPLINILTVNDGRASQTERCGRRCGLHQFRWRRQVNGHPVFSLSFYRRQLIRTGHWPSS